MTRRPIRNTQAFAGQAAGQRATVEMDTGGLVYFENQLIYTEEIAGVPTRATDAVFRAGLTRLEILLGGVVQREASAGEIIDIAAFKGRPINAGILPLEFAQGERVILADQDSTAFGTGDIDEFVIAATIAAGRLAPVLDLRSLVQPATNAVKVGIIATWLRQQVDATGAGVKRASFTGSGRKISHIHCFSTQINSVKVSRGSTVMFDLDRAEADELYEAAGYVPQANMFTISWEALTGRLSDALQLGGQNLNFEFTMAAADTFDFIVEEIGLRRT